MRSRFHGVAILVFLVGALAQPAMAQIGQPERSLGPTPGDLPPSIGRTPKYSLDTLFAALKLAPDADTAKAIENRIWARWNASDSDTCSLLMTRAKTAIDQKNYDLAIKLLDAVIAIKPDFVEAWNRRATVYYLEDDFGHALADLQEVLAREPRHFGALAGLGTLLQDIGDDKDALKAYRKALEIDPHLEHIPDLVKSLTEKIEGRNI